MFRFKQFSVRNEAAAMKVGTDAVLLGAAVSLKESDSRILDAGTGTGVIALMLAQRTAKLRDDDSWKIVGVDIDKLASEEASENFAASPWSPNLEAVNTSLFVHAGVYDLIVSNPPYFDDSLPAPEARRNTARHTGGEAMSAEQLLRYSAEHLSESGRLAMILPADALSATLRLGRSYGVDPYRVVRIRTVARKPPARVIIEFCRQRLEFGEEELLLQEKGLWTKEYTDLVKDFYLWA